MNNAITIDHDKLLAFSKRPDTFVNPADVQKIRSSKPEYICTGRNIVYPFFVSTVLNEGNWKTNPPECFESNPSGCRSLIDIVDGQLSIKTEGCGKN